MMTKAEAQAYLDAHPTKRGDRTRWVLQAIKDHNGLRWTEIQRLWLLSEGLDLDEMDSGDRIFDAVLNKFIPLGTGKRRRYRGHGCTHFHGAHNRPGVLNRYCARDGNKYVVIKPIIGPWNPETRWDGRRHFTPAIGEYVHPRS